MQIIELPQESRYETSYEDSKRSTGMITHRITTPTAKIARRKGSDRLHLESTYNDIEHLQKEILDVNLI